MTSEEFEQLCAKLKAQGMTEKDILGTILKMFEDGKIDLEEMKKLAGSVGYELSDEFVKEQESPAEEVAPEGEISEEEVQEAQESESSESEEEGSESGESEEFKEEESDESEEEAEAEEEGEESESEGAVESEEESEEDEKEKARKLFDLA